MQQQQFKKERYKKEVFDLLPSSISSIQVQKKNTYRYSIFVEDQFLIGVSDSTLVHFSLSKGAILSPSIFHEILEKEDKWAIREYLIRLLGRRDHSRNELSLKAIKKGFDQKHVEPILDELTQKKYINNSAFARKFALDKFRFNKWGIHRIKAELKSKGLIDKEIDLACSNLDKKEIITTIEQLVNKNKRKFKRTDTFKRKKKIFDFLIRKGYDSNVILRLMPKLLESIEK